jgi:hypothetical protein
LIMLKRLQTTLGVSGIVWDWFCSYLSGWSQHISINVSLSDKYDLDCGVPQGSCFGPFLFSIYVSKLFNIIEAFANSSFLCWWFTTLCFVQSKGGQWAVWCYHCYGKVCGKYKTMVDRR